MSVAYYLICDDHKEYVFMSDNKGNPCNRVPMRNFLSDHNVINKCPLYVLNEYDFENLELYTDYVGYWIDEDDEEGFIKE